MKHYLLLACLSLVLFYSCKSNNPPSSSQTADTIVSEKIGSPTSEDTQGDYTIYRVETDMNTQYPAIKYLILDEQSLEIIKEGSITMGSIKWVNENQIEILDLPRVMPMGKSMSDYKEIINIY